MKHILSAALVAVSLLSYSQETKKAPAKLNVKVVIFFIRGSQLIGR